VGVEKTSGEEDAPKDEEGVNWHMEIRE